MSLVVDSSITLAWFFEDERTDVVTSVLRRVVDDRAIVPSLWRYEVANGLAMAVRRKRIDEAYRDRALSNLSTLRVEIDGDSDQRVWSATVETAAQHRLTIYDATYLELAQRRRLSLATLDEALRRAAVAVGVALLGV